MDTTEKTRAAAPEAQKDGETKVKVKKKTAAPGKAAPPKSAASGRAGAPKTDAEVDEQPRKEAAAPKKKSTASRRRPAQDVPDKKRAYGRSKKKEDAGMSGLFKRTAQRQAEKKAKEKEEQEKKPAKKHRTPLPEVIYSQPKVFSGVRLVMQLLAVVLVVAALVVGLSVFFKVERVEVSGNVIYDRASIQEASGIKVGDNLLTFSHARAAAKIQAEKEYINSVRFGIKLPGTVNIIIDEAEVVYAIEDRNGTYWLITSGGRVVKQADKSSASNHTQIEGVTIEVPEPDDIAKAAENAPVMETLEDGATVPAVVTVTAAQRLSAVLQILTALEDNGIVGDAARVNVSQIEDIYLMYGTRYQVKLGDASRLDYKIACMNDAILQLSDYQSGILDISFTIWPNQVGYTPFG